MPIAGVGGWSVGAEQPTIVNLANALCGQLMFNSIYENFPQMPALRKD